MSKKHRIVTIDFNKWQKQADYIRDTGVNQQTFSKKLTRSRKGIGVARIEFLDVPELNITLVERSDYETTKKYITNVLSD